MLVVSPAGSLSSGLTNSSTYSLTSSLTSCSSKASGDTWHHELWRDHMQHRKVKPTEEPRSLFQANPTYSLTSTRTSDRRKGSLATWHQELWRKVRSCAMAATPSPCQAGGGNTLHSAAIPRIAAATTTWSGPLCTHGRGRLHHDDIMNERLRNVTVAPRIAAAATTWSGPLCRHGQRKSHNDIKTARVT